MDDNHEGLAVGCVVVVGIIAIVVLIWAFILLTSNLKNPLPQQSVTTNVTYRNDICMNTDTHTYAYFKVEYNAALGTIVTTVGKNGDLINTLVVGGVVTEQYVTPMNLCKWKQAE